jgi:hypothetical protein
VIGTVERYQDEAGARAAMAGFLAEVNSEKVRMRSRSMAHAPEPHRHTGLIRFLLAKLVACFWRTAEAIGHGSDSR